MRNSFHLLSLLALLLLFSFKVSAQNSRSSSSKPPVQQRNTEAAKAAEAEGQDFLFQKHDVKSAIESFKKATKLDPWYEHSYLMLGLACMQAERWDEAQWAFEDASKVDPNDAQAWLGVGSALNEQKDYTGAQKALEHSLELKPDSAEAHYELARSLWSLGRLQPAGEHARRAIELNKNYASPHLLMGNIYVDQSDADNALAEFREALRLEPEGSQADEIKEMIARIEKAQSQPAQAKKR